MSNSTSGSFFAVAAGFAAVPAAGACAKAVAADSASSGIVNNKRRMFLLLFLTENESMGVAMMRPKRDTPCNSLSLARPLTSYFLLFQSFQLSLRLRVVRVELEYLFHRGD